MDVSDRRMQVWLTPEAKIASDFIFIGAIFAVVGFVSALKAPPATGALLRFGVYRRQLSAAESAANSSAAAGQITHV